MPREPLRPADSSAASLRRATAAVFFSESPHEAKSCSIAWYRTSSSPVPAYVNETVPKPADRIRTPTTVLWQEFDPIFPKEWSDRLDEFFADVSLEMLNGVGHYTPLEATDRFASAIKKRF